MKSEILKIISYIKLITMLSAEATLGSKKDNNTQGNDENTSIVTNGKTIRLPMRE